MKDKSRAAARVGSHYSAADQAIQNTASADDLVPEPDSVAPVQPKKRGHTTKSCDIVTKKPIRRGRGHPRKRT